MDIDAPVILTNRSRREGGAFRGAESERVRYLAEGMASGVECVDLEFSTPKRLLRKLLGERPRSTSILLSYHNFRYTPKPSKLRDLAVRMTRHPCDLIKIVTAARNMRDCQRVLEFAVTSQDVTDLPVIAFAMGRAGLFTRFLGAIVGVPLVYAAAGRPTAQGQLSVRESVRVLNSLSQWEVKD